MSLNVLEFGLLLAGFAFLLSAGQDTNSTTLSSLEIASTTSTLTISFITTATENTTTYRSSQEPGFSTIPTNSHADSMNSLNLTSQALTTAVMLTAETTTLAPSTSTQPTIPVTSQGTTSSVVHSVDNLGTAHEVTPPIITTQETSIPTSITSSHATISLQVTTAPTTTQHRITTCNSTNQETQTQVIPTQGSMTNESVHLFTTVQTASEPSTIRAITPNNISSSSILFSSASSRSTSTEAFSTFEIPTSQLTPVQETQAQSETASHGSSTTLMMTTSTPMHSVERAEIQNIPTSTSKFEPDPTQSEWPISAASSAAVPENTTLSVDIIYFPVNTTLIFENKTLGLTNEEKEEYLSMYARNMTLVVVIMVLLNIMSLTVAIFVFIRLSKRSHRWDRPPSRCGSRRQYFISKPAVAPVVTCTHIGGRDLANDVECQDGESYQESVPVVVTDAGWCVPLSEDKKKVNHEVREEEDTGV